MSSIKSKSIKSDKKDKKMVSNIDNNEIDDIIKDLQSYDNSDTDNDSDNDSDNETDVETNDKSDNDSDNENIPEISEISISNIINDDDDDSDEENEIKTIQEVDIAKVTKKTTKNTAKKNKTGKPIKNKTISTLYSKKKDITFNLNRLIANIQLSEPTDQNVYSLKDKDSFVKSLKFPTWLSISKKTKLDNLQNPTIIITDDISTELKLKQNLIIEISQNNKHDSILFLNATAYTAFIKLFSDLKSNTLSFGTLQSVIGLFLISEKIILATKFKTSSYIFFLIAKKLNISNKIIFTKEDLKIGNIDIEYSNNITQQIKDFDVDTTVLCDFLKLNKYPSTYTEGIIFDMFKIFNFKSQLKYEAFDGLTKIMLKNIKKNKLYKKDFSFLTLISDFSDEYPMISEKEILQHYSYILNNFNKNSQIPLFEFNDSKITKKTRVKVDKKIFDKILSLTVIVKKNYGEFWTSMIPFQLFYAKDFYSLDLNKILNYFVDNDTTKLIIDNDKKMYKYTSNKGITMSKNFYQLELTGAENNILKHVDPTMNYEEFILKLINGNVSHTIKDNMIVINDTKKASRYIKFKIDKENTIFDFKNISIMGKNNDKLDHYDSVLKYYNEYICFNIKLFKAYAIQHIKNSNQDISEMLTNIYKEESKTTALLNPYNYPSSYVIDEKDIIFDTKFFDDLKTDIDEDEFNSDECLSYIKNKIKECYKTFLN